MKLSLTDFALIAGAGAVAYTVYKASKVVDTVSDVVQNDINPASRQNVINRGVNSIGAAVSGNDSFTLGSWLYDITHPKEDLTADLPVEPLNNNVGNTVNKYEEDVL